MPKKSKATDTHIAFILDRSGSMTSIWSDVQGGFKTFINDQKKLGNPKFTFTTFDTEYDTVYDATPLKDVSPEFDHTRVFPRGMTALLDAVAHTINLIAALPDQAKKVMVVIFTDGHENSSHEITKAALKTLIDSKQKAGWGFLFLGADQDAFAAGSQMGMNVGQTMSFRSAQKGSTGGTMAAASTSTADYLYAGKPVDVPAEWVDPQEKTSKAKVKTP